MIDHRELSALHSANVKLCLSVPNFGKNLPSDRMCDIFTHLGDLFPAPAPAAQHEFDVVLNDVSVLISGLMEYYSLSQAVFKGKIFLDIFFLENGAFRNKPFTMCPHFILFLCGSPS